MYREQILTRAVTIVGELIQVLEPSATHAHAVHRMANSKNAARARETLVDTESDGAGVVVKDAYENNR